MSKKRSDDDFMDMRSAMDRFKKSKNLENGIDRVTVEQAWSKIMGPAVDRYSDRVVYRQGTLTVNLSSSVLRNELLYGRSKIIKNLNDYLGREMVEKVVLR